MTGGDSGTGHLIDETMKDAARVQNLDGFDVIS